MSASPLPYVLRRMSRRKPPVPVFAPPTPEGQAKRACLLARPAPTVCYSILFTARSGSSWLTDACRRAGGLGAPHEAFRAETVSRRAKLLGATSVSEHVDLLSRSTAAPDGVFGFEATYGHVIGAFGSARSYARVCGSWPHVLLIREDIVAQAVSLAIMMATGRAHRVEGAVMHNKATAPEWRYDAEIIAEALAITVGGERGLRRLMAVCHFEPLWMSYERNMSRGSQATVDALASHVGAAPHGEAQSAHGRLSDGRNIDHARRFRAENRWMVARIERGRRATLAALDRQG